MAMVEKIIERFISADTCFPLIILRVGLFFNLSEMGSCKNEQLCSPMEQVGEAATRSAVLFSLG
jgi:hypothetical protein